MQLRNLIMLYFTHVGAVDRSTRTEAFCEQLTCHHPKGQEMGGVRHVPPMVPLYLRWS